MSRQVTANVPFADCAHAPLLGTIGVTLWFPRAGPLAGSRGTRCLPGLPVKM